MKLASDETHLWLGSREVPGDRWRRLDSVLSPDERDRGGRLRRSDDRRRFVAARGLLRHVLAAYADAAPERLRFTYGPMGQPRLAGPHAGEDLSFNLSLLGGVSRRHSFLFFSFEVLGFQTNQTNRVGGSRHNPAFRVNLEREHGDGSAPALSS